MHGSRPNQQVPGGVAIMPGVLDWEDDMDLSEDEPLRIRHPWECLPYRPPMSARWEPSHRRTSVPGADEERPAPIFNEPGLTAAANLGAVRVNFKYASFAAVMASHSEKAGRDQFFESHHETFGYRLHEIGPQYLDVQYQPIELSYTDAAGRAHSIFLDYAVETDRNEILFGEDKAAPAYFQDPELKERLDFAEAYLGKLGAGLERRVAGGLPSRIARRVVKRIFDARKTTFRPDEVESVLGVIGQAGGVACYGDLVEALRHPLRHSEDILAAMMCKRHIAIDIGRPIMRDTPVRIPLAAKKGALREFLARYVTPTDDCG